MTHEPSQRAAEAPRTRGTRIFLILVVIGGFCALFLRGCDGSLRAGVSPSAPRNLAQLNRLLEPTAAPKPIAGDPLDSFQLTNEAGRATVLLRQPRTAKPSFYGYKVHEVNLSAPTKLAGGEISLRAIATALPDSSLAGAEHSRPLPAKFFDNRLQPLSSNAVQAMFPNPWERQIYAQGHRPEFRLHLVTTNMPELKLLAGEVRDARTGYQLNYSYSASAGESGLQFGPTVGMWHKGPVIVTLDVAYGPTETEDVALKVGATIAHAQGELTYAGSLQGRNQGMSMSSSFMAGHTKTIFTQSTNQPGSSFLFVAGPASSMALPVDLFFVTDKGELQSSGANSSGSLIMFMLDAPRETIQRVRVKKYPNVMRLVLRLPYLPGLPEVNENIRDLLKLHIPFVKFQGEWEMRSFVEQATQLSLQHRNGLAVPNAYFPRSYTNVTVEDVLEDFRSLHPPPARLVIKQKSNEIQIRDSFLKELFRRLRF